MKFNWRTPQSDLPIQWWVVVTVALVVVGTMLGTACMARWLYGGWVNWR